MNRSNAYTTLTVSTIVAFIASIFSIFIYAPVEAESGIIQKIFYVHVPSAWVGLLAFFVVFVTSIAFLRTKKEEWYIRSRSAAEIGVIFTTIVLVTGPIWGRIAWGTWWNWYDTKLDSALLLWLLYLGYVLIGSAVEEPDKRARFQSVYGIVAFLDVPIVFMSIRWWQQLGTKSQASHPIVFTSFNLTENMPASMVITLLISLAAFTILYSVLMMLRTDIERTAFEIEALKEEEK